MKIIKTPFGSGGLGKTEMTAYSPENIVKELNEFYLSERLNYTEYAVAEIQCLQNDAGQSHQNIYQYVKEVDSRFILIGGDHSITYPSFKAFSGGNTGLIVFDAHADCMHGTETASHEDYLRKLVQEGIIDPQKIVLIGLRNIHKIEKNFLNNNKINHFNCHQIYRNGIDNICDEAMSILRKTDNFYVSVDIDILDPAFAPGTNHLEPAGLTTRELIYFLQRIKYLKKPFSGDVVEVDTTKDLNNLTTRAAAKIIKELI